MPKGIYNRKAKEEAASPERIFHPIVKDPTTPHIFEELEALGETPVLISIGLIQVKGTNNFVSYVMKSKGSQVLRVDLSDPNIYGIVEEQLKIDFVQLFTPEDKVAG